MNIEQIAYEEASGEMLDCFSKEQLAGYLLRCLSKLAELAEQDVEPEVMHEPGNPINTAPTDWWTKKNGWCPLFTEAQLLAAQQRTAEACAKVCNSRRRTVSNGNGLSMWSHDPASVEAGYCADAISNGDWREYL